jgi:hypothetical protein
MELIAPVVAASFRNLKDYNEVMLARELYEVLSASSEFMQEARNIGRLAIEWILALGAALPESGTVRDTVAFSNQQGGNDAMAQLARGGRFKSLLEAFEGVLQKESGLKIWGSGIGERSNKSAFIARLQQLKATQLGLNDVSELLRLFGGVVEDMAGAVDALQTTEALALTVQFTPTNRPARPIQFFPISEMNQMRGSYRTAYGGEPFKGSVRARYQMWAKAGEQPQRVDLTTEAGRKKGKQLKKDGWRLRGLTDEQERYVQLSEDERGSYGARGMTLWELKQGSVVWAIDRIFGLPPGADISGTTADIMWGLETLATILYPYPSPGSDRRPAVLPLLYMLPIAAMVAHYHHTILECAMTQTLNGEITYQIGCYTTLLSENAIDSGLVTALKRVLKRWEDHPTNFKAVFLQESGTLLPQSSSTDRTQDLTWGILFTTPEEIQSYKALATVSFERWNSVFKPLKDLERIGLSHLQSVLSGVTQIDLVNVRQNLQEAMVARQNFRLTLMRNTGTAGY